MEIERDIRVEKKEEEENMCTSLLTAVIILSMTCLKHYSSVSYLIEQWRSLVFLLLNIVLLAVYFTSTRPISGENHFKIHRGGRLRMMRGKKEKKIVEPACSKQNFLLIEPANKTRSSVVVETKTICPKINETEKDFIFHKKSMDIVAEEDEYEAGRLSNEELNERAEAFITTFRQHLVRDARRSRNRELDHKRKPRNSDVDILRREVYCSV